MAFRSVCFQEEPRHSKRDIRGPSFPRHPSSCPLPARWVQLSLQGPRCQFFYKMQTGQAKTTSNANDHVSLQNHKPANRHLPETPKCLLYKMPNLGRQEAFCRGNRQEDEKGALTGLLRGDFCRKIAMANGRSTSPEIRSSTLHGAEEQRR